MGKRIQYGCPEPEAIPGQRWLELGDGVFARVDDENYAALKDFKWFLKKSGEPVTQVPDHENPQLWRQVSLKSMILRTALTKGQIIVHIDRNPKNCTRANLKVTSLKEGRAPKESKIAPWRPRRENLITRFPKELAETKKK